MDVRIKTNSDPLEQGQTVHKMQIETFCELYLYIPLAHLYIYTYIAYMCMLCIHKVCAYCIVYGGSRQRLVPPRGLDLRIYITERGKRIYIRRQRTLYVYFSFDHIYRKHCIEY